MRIGEQLLDLGPHGILALTTASGAYGPIPAETYGLARLSLGGALLDRLECCTRPASMDMLQANMAELRSYLAHAVDGVQRQLAWAQARFSQGFREMPAQAAVLGERLVLLAFTALKPYAFRVIEPREGRVLWEMTDEALLAVHGIKPSHAMHSFRSEPLLRACAGGRAVIGIGTSIVVFQWNGTALEPLPWTVRDEYIQYDLTMDRVLRQPDSNRDDREALEPATGTPVGVVKPMAKPKQWARLVTAPGTNRVAFVHRGGTVDVIEDMGASGYSMRPVPRAGRNDDLTAHLQYSGKYLGVREWTSFIVIDIDKRLVAQIDSPVPNMSDDSDNVIYDSDLISAHPGIFMVQDREITFYDYASMRWEPVLQPGNKAAGAKKPTEWKQHLEQWEKPALTLVPKKGGPSQMYGLASIPNELVPRHEDEPMMLLAQIDLAEAARVLPENPWPSEGLLCFFVPIDGEGHLLEDDSLNPQAVRVLLFKGAPVIPAEEGPYPPISCVLRASRETLPHITSPIVEGAHLDEANLEAYREYYEKKGLGDANPGHRLGGYPTILQNNDLEAQAAVKAGDLDDYPRDMAEVAACARWRLLLQLDSDDEFMWGTDSGMLYFLIQDDDLARADFSRVVAITEGF